MRPGEIRGRHIWVIAKGYAPDEGGMQFYAQGVAEAYARLGALVTIFTRTSAGPRSEQAGRIRLVDVGGGKGAGVAIRLLLAMRRQRRLSAPFFVHGTTWRTALLPMILGLPYLVSFHGREFMYARGPVLFAMRQAAQRALRIVAVSHYSARKLTARLGPDVAAPVVAWNGTRAGLAVPAGDKPSGTPPRILSLCRLERRKNIMACVFACAALADRGLSFRYVVAGRGPEEQSIRAFVAAIGLADRIEIAGHVSDDELTRLYREADIFLHPQIEIDDGRDFEGFGIAIADAMLASAAPIVGRAGGAIELVEDGRSGLVVDGADHEALVTALAALLGDAEKRRAMAAAAAARASAFFTWDRHADILLGSLCTGPRAPRRGAPLPGVPDAGTR